MEVAGIVLSCIQAALEIYDRIGPRISAYRNYRKKVDSSIIHLVSQQTIFEICGNDLIQALHQNRDSLDSWLTNVAGSDRFGHACDTSSSPTLITPENFRKQIEHCERLVLSIRSCLEILGAELDRFALKTENHQRAPGLLKRLAYASFKRDESFLNAVRELVRLNQSFSAIAAGIIKRIEWVSTGSHSSPDASRKWSATEVDAIAKYQRVRSASTKLYETMAEGWLCRSHQSHYVSVAFVEGIHQPETVRFDIAVSVGEGNALAAANPSNSSPGMALSPLWLEVEHLEPSDTPASEAEVPDPFTTAVVDSLDAAVNKKTLQPPPLPPSSVTPLSLVAFSPSTPSRLSNPAREGQPQRLERDLTASVSDFCHHFTAQYQTNPSRRECLGLLRRQQRYLQKCYLPPRDRRYTGSVLSLDALISWAKEQATIRALDRPLVSKLAKSLAISILHFHSTPWLCDSWKSSNIGFFDRGGFLDCELNPSQPHLQVALDMTNPAAPKAVPAQNSKLFLDFAKALLQVGFSSSWESLRDGISRDSELSADPDRNTTHYVASQLCQQLKRKLGARYAKVVERCIDADLKALHSGEDDQILFFVEVAGVMQDLDERWQKFQQSLFTNLI
ncbi:hypothetical protein QBC44DRAFT_381435 [Cladorrhinum sp. PSN332]|nr:hypothetical protein QBC44DRAFT_381435 [Cladorrhinum sp. PSN332]